MYSRLAAPLALSPSSDSFSHGFLHFWGLASDPWGFSSPHVTFTE